MCPFSLTVQHDAYKSSLAICRKSMASCPVSRFLSLYSLHVLNRDVNMIQTKQTIQKSSAVCFCRIFQIISRDGTLWRRSMQFTWYTRCRPFLIYNVATYITNLPQPYRVISQVLAHVVILSKRFGAKISTEHISVILPHILFGQLHESRW